MPNAVSVPNAASDNAASDNAASDNATASGTYDEWTSCGGYVLAKGESVIVVSSKDPSIMYKVTRAANSNSIYCSCPAWKFQRLNPAVRTCKHCIAVCGAKAERLRCAQATLCLQQMNELMGKNFKI